MCCCQPHHLGLSQANTYSAHYIKTRITVASQQTLRQRWIEEGFTSYNTIWQSTEVPETFRKRSQWHNDPGAAACYEQFWSYVRLGRVLSNGLQRSNKATLAMINDDTRRLSTRYRVKVPLAQLRQQGMEDLSKGRDRTVNRIVKETKMVILTPHPALLILATAGFKAQPQ